MFNMKAKWTRSIRRVSPQYVTLTLSGWHTAWGEFQNSGSCQPECKQKCWRTKGKFKLSDAQRHTQAAQRIVFGLWLLLVSFEPPGTHKQLHFYFRKMWKPKKDIQRVGLLNYSSHHFRPSIRSDKWELVPIRTCISLLRTENWWTPSRFFLRYSSKLPVTLWEWHKMWKIISDL